MPYLNVYDCRIHKRRRRDDFLKRNTDWTGVKISWTGSFEDGKYIVRARAGEDPWLYIGACVITPGAHLVDACDSIIDGFLGRYWDGDRYEYYF